MSGEYKIGRLNGRFVVTWIDAAGKRHRHRLDAADARGAAIEAPGIVDIVARPKGKTVGELWEFYEREYEGRAVLETMKYTQRALKMFWPLAGDAITARHCKAHIAKRRKAGIAEWTIYTELGHLRSVLLNAEKHKLIGTASNIFRPEQPKPKEDKNLTRAEVRRLIDGTEFHHVRLAIILLYTTAARSSALCGLTWSRCDYDRNRIDLRDPSITRPQKGRAIVPMLRTARAALREAQEGALSNYVIEWAGKPVKSLKRGIKTAARKAGIAKTVSPHILRHSAAVHMAEDRVSMEEIQQFLGHEDIETTRKIYARFSPDYLRRAAAALEFDDLEILHPALPRLHARLMPDNGGTLSAPEDATVNVDQLGRASNRLSTWEAAEKPQQSRDNSQASRRHDRSERRSSSPSNQNALPKPANDALILLDNLVGAAGIEPTTPTMSRKTALGKRWK